MDRHKKRMGQIRNAVQRFFGQSFVLDFDGSLILNGQRSSLRNDPGERNF